MPYSIFTKWSKATLKAILFRCFINVDVSLTQVLHISISGKSVSFVTKVGVLTNLVTFGSATPAGEKLLFNSGKSDKQLDSVTDLTELTSLVIKLNSVRPLGFTHMIKSLTSP